MNKKQLVELFNKSIKHRASGHFRKNEYGEELTLTYDVGVDNHGNSLGRIVLYAEARLKDAFEEAGTRKCYPVYYVIRFIQYDERGTVFEYKLTEKEFFAMSVLFKESKKRYDRNVKIEANEISLPYLEEISILFDLDIAPRTRKVLIEKYYDDYPPNYRL